MVALLLYGPVAFTIVKKVIQRKVPKFCLLVHVHGLSRDPGLFF